jgi:hypothetical protein
MLGRMQDFYAIKLPCYTPFIDWSLSADGMWCDLQTEFLDTYYTKFVLQRIEWKNY